MSADAEQLEPLLLLAGAVAAPLVIGMLADPVSAAWTALCARVAHAWVSLLLALCCAAPGAAQALANIHAHLTHRMHGGGRRG